MNLARLMRCGVRLMEARLAGRRRPVVVAWRLTNRCNLHCRYCALPSMASEELSAAEIGAAMELLKSRGTEVIGFTGGEPLLRDDIGEILDKAAELDFTHSVNSNGVLVREKLDALRHIDMLRISLDGPEDVHDAVRGRGSFALAMGAVEAAKSAGIEVGLTAVLTPGSLDALEWLLATAARLRAMVQFQPATPRRLGDREANPAAPDGELARAVFRRLIDEKRRGNRWIASSFTALRHLARYPDDAEIPCFAGSLYCKVEANGDVRPCVDLDGPSPCANIRSDGAAAFARAGVVTCRQCWCASRVDFNFAAGLHPEAALHLLSTIAPSL